MLFRFIKEKLRHITQGGLLQNYFRHYIEESRITCISNQLAHLSIE